MLALFPSSAAADPGVLAVRAKGLAQEQSIAVQAVTEVVTRAGWTLTPPTAHSRSPHGKQPRGRAS